MAARRKHRSGFSLIELVIVIVIIAIIGAIAIPKMSRAVAGAGDSATVQNLSTMRSAISLYTTEHNGLAPSAASAATLLSQLTTYTDINGTVSATKSNTCIYGPYMASIPALPVGTNKGLTSLTVTGPVGTGAFAWYYDGTTIWANDPATDIDAKGVQYNAY
jgi:prepilin-type N-terminal cleavage/methylation domain-containing protein